MTQKTGTYEMEQKVLAVMHEADPKPVSSTYIERKLGINYKTALSNFEEMIKRGLVHKIETVSYNFFVLSDWKPDFLREKRNQKN